MKKDQNSDVSANLEDTVSTTVPVELSPHQTVRTKRRDSPRSADAPTQQRKVKKRREDKVPPTLSQNQTEVLPDVKLNTTNELVTFEENNLRQIEEWVRQFEQFSNSKQSLALSMLVPRYGQFILFITAGYLLSSGVSQSESWSW